MKLEFEFGRVLIIGGTGSLGQALVKEIRAVWPTIEIAVLSRDEHKQAYMRREYPECEYIIGNIRDDDSLFRAMQRRDIVFNVAALKHVDAMEQNTVECYKTNVEGNRVAADLAVDLGVPNYVFSSTDKAVDPINMYGFCKAASEKILFDLNRKQSRTKCSVYRWGNVLGSNGSALPYFVKTLKESASVNLTHMEMTRFWIPIEWAVQYMLITIDRAKTDTAMIPPTMKAMPVVDVIDCLAQMLGVGSYRMNITGLRPGEKLHESIRSIHEEFPLSSNHAEQYSRLEMMELLKPLVRNA